MINPFGGQVYRVSLKPEHCIGIVFWTRNATPLMRRLDELDAMGYRYYFQYTINGYPTSIESNNPSLESAISTFRKLSTRVSKDYIHWRYDPILLSDITPVEYHLKKFELIASFLEGYTSHCTFSFVDFYGKTQRNLARVSNDTKIVFEEPHLTLQQDIVGELVSIAMKYGMTLYSCCNNALAIHGAYKNRCVDPELIRKLAVNSVPSIRAEPTRKDCGCVSSVDIGAYDTCLFGCTYCYATNSRAAAIRRFGLHDPMDTTIWRPKTLIGVDLDSISRELAK